MATEYNLPSAEELKAKFFKATYGLIPHHSEINLVPDIKNDTIKAIKLRNLTFFICIVVASVCGVAIVAFASFAAGQQAIVDSNKNTIDTLSSKMNSYADLSNFLTIKDQLGNLSAIADNKTLLSRAFNILSAIIPTGADTITISELGIDLTDASPTISFDAQANAGQPPYIDYNVLDSFKKSMPYIHYDYGNYVDRNGQAIPAYCIIERGDDGATFTDSQKGIYGLWLITGEGCNPSEDTLSKYAIESYEGQNVVRIWRTPQFASWYSASQMDLSSTISGVAHFESKCTTYSGSKNEATGAVEWSSSISESCRLVPDNGISISDSSNGRDGEGELVLRFSASITLSPEFFKAGNTHMLAVGPTGRYNVTDSYVQVQNIFGAPATDCAANDVSCKNGGGN